MRPRRGSVQASAATVVQVAGEVEEGGEATGGAGEFGCPAGQVGEVPAAGGQAGLQVAFEVLVAEPGLSAICQHTFFAGFIPVTPPGPPPVVGC
jgi:hypothetical protein